MQYLQGFVYSSNGPCHTIVQYFLVLVEICFFCIIVYMVSELRGQIQTITFKHQQLWLPTIIPAYCSYMLGALPYDSCPTTLLLRSIMTLQSATFFTTLIILAFVNLCLYGMPLGRRTYFVASLCFLMLFLLPCCQILLKS